MHPGVKRRVLQGQCQPVLGMRSGDMHPDKSYLRSIFAWEVTSCISVRTWEWLCYRTSHSGVKVTLPALRIKETWVKMRVLSERHITPIVTCIKEWCLGVMMGVVWDQYLPTWEVTSRMKMWVAIIVCVFATSYPGVKAIVACIRLMSSCIR